MFKPDLQQHEFDGVSDLVMNTIRSCDIDVRKCLYENIILSGKVTLIFRGVDNVPGVPDSSGERC